MILGIDYGDKRIGLAIAAEQSSLATPWQLLPNKNKDQVLTDIKNIINSEDIKTIIVGLPLSLAGLDSQRTIKTKQFINLLKENLSLPIISQDERLSSSMSDTVMQDKNLGRKKAKTYDKISRDEMAATIILQHYLDKQA